MLNNGMSFGELSLIKEQPRAASILCNTDCHFAVLSKDHYMEVIGKIEAKKLDSFIEFLISIPMFKHWTKKKLEMLSYHFSCKSYKRKQIVFNIGSPAVFVYIVKNGEFELMKPMIVKNSSGEEEVFMTKLALLEKGEVFCDEEVVAKSNNSCICTCYSTIGELLAISSEDFLLKVQNEDCFKEFNYKNRSKSFLRRTRLENFKDYILNQKFKKIINLTKKESPSPISLIKPGSRSPAIQKQTMELTGKILEKIKTRALGRTPILTNYLNLKPLKDGIFTGEDLKNTLSTRRKRENSINSSLIMKSHRPGGYFRANLKKSFSGYRSSSINNSKTS